MQSERNLEKNLSLGACFACFLSVSLFQWKKAENVEKSKHFSVVSPFLSLHYIAQKCKMRNGKEKQIFGVRVKDVRCLSPPAPAESLLISALWMALLS